MNSTFFLIFLTYASLILRVSVYTSKKKNELKYRLNSNHRNLPMLVSTYLNLEKKTLCLMRMLFRISRPLFISCLHLRFQVDRIQMRHQKQRKIKSRAQSSKFYHLLCKSAVIIVPIVCQG